MTIDATHPQFDAMKNKWIMLDDFFRGELNVKQKGTVYLPPTSSMIANDMRDGQLGAKEYAAYNERASFPEYVNEAVETFVGLMFTKDPNIELPAKMEPLRDNATTNNETLIMLLRRIYVEQLSKGRVGLLADIPQNPDPSNPLPYLTTYDALSVRNWDDGENGDTVTTDVSHLNFVILDESGVRRLADTFDWEDVTRYRLLINRGEGYETGLFVDNATFDDSLLMTPQYRGQSCDEIPFVFINSKDILPRCDEPPLIQLANLCAAIYRVGADYYQNLHMQGQDTLVIIGDTKNKDSDDDGFRIGTGAVIQLETGSEAKFIGVNSNGLAEQRECLADMRSRAEVMCGKLSSSRTGSQESGEALKIRVAAQTAMLVQIATTGAKGLEKALKIIAKWIGENPDEVTVTPNLEFTDYDLSGVNLLNMMKAIAAGAPISLESVHANLQKQGFTDLDFETEMKKVSKDGLQTALETPNLLNNTNQQSQTTKEVKDASLND